MSNRPLKRRGVRADRRALIAYDLETTNIAEGTPDVLYITAFGHSFKVSKEIRDLSALRRVLLSDFLVESFDRARFVAWNGNRFDAYFVALALLDSGYLLKPYMTRGGGLRGLRVETPLGQKPKMAWEFLDGMAMSGMDAMGMPLRDFVKQFAPGFRKLRLDFAHETFNPQNPKHVAYAERDSEALYYAMQSAGEKLFEVTGQSWRPTLGAVAVRHLRANIPNNVLCWQAPKRCREALITAMRGGYCVIQKKYRGDIWKYDLNQAYAAAMREARLPSGRCIESRYFREDKAGVWRVHAVNHKNIVPFYWKQDDGTPEQTTTVIGPCWLTTAEVSQLQAEGWEVDIEGGWYWTNHFNFRSMVDRLETLRREAGPKSPLGLVAKCIGNSAYGKTAERLRGETLVFSKDKPGKGFFQYRAEVPAFRYVWCKLEDSPPRDYHRMQIAATITAHVRMVVRRAALLSPEAFLYADTDCVAFTEPVEGLDIDTSRYGAWKPEVEGKEYIVVGKKAYAATDGSEYRCKGLPTSTLSVSDYEHWLNGAPPAREVLQRRSFKKLLEGDMFVRRERVAEIVRAPP